MREPDSLSMDLLNEQKKKGCVVQEKKATRIIFWRKMNKYQNFENRWNSKKLLLLFFPFFFFKNRISNLGSTGCDETIRRLLQRTFFLISEKFTEYCRHPGIQHIKKNLKKNTSDQVRIKIHVKKKTVCHENIGSLIISLCCRALATMSYC